MLAGDLPNNGWVIRDAAENDVEGAAQGLLSRETPQDPPETTLPHLVLRFDGTGAPPPPAPDPGGPATLACGDVVLESVVLQNDLLNCLGEGLVIGAPDIEVDLNGHTSPAAPWSNPARRTACSPASATAGTATS